MRIKILSILLFLVSFVSLPFVASAHVLQSDGSIGAVLHIDPNDDPIVGQEATLAFEFKDKQGRFSIDKCDCRLDILLYDATVFTQTLTGESINYTFPQKGIYRLMIAGVPKTGEDFQSFNLSYDLRVDKTGEPEAVPQVVFISQHVLHFILLGGVFVIFFIKYLIDILREKRKNKANN